MFNYLQRFMILVKNYYEDIKIYEYKITIYGGPGLIKVVFPARNFQH